DATLSIASTFAKSAPFPVYIHRNESRLGHGATFIRAANFCRSDLIAFCDQDDIWYHNKIAVCAERFSEPEMLLVYHDADVVTSDGMAIGSLDLFTAPQPILPPMSFHPMAHVLGFTLVFRRFLLKFSALWSLAVNHLEPTKRLGHDQWVFFFASAL